MSSLLLTSLKVVWRHKLLKPAMTDSSSGSSWPLIGMERVWAFSSPSQLRALLPLRFKLDNELYGSSPWLTVHELDLWARAFKAEPRFAPTQIFDFCLAWERRESFDVLCNSSARFIILKLKVFLEDFLVSLNICFFKKYTYFANLSF